MSPTPGRDWDKELAEIDKLMGQPPSGQPPQRQAAGGPAAKTAPSGGRRAILFTWARLGLGLALGAAMTQWPYTHGCGVPLFGYLGGVGTVVAASFWSMISSWRTRSGFAHFLSIGLLFWGMVLAGREVLPRIGYAKQSAGWLCEVSRPATP